MKKMRNNRGFTLVELIIAVAILAIVITPLIANFIRSSKLNLKGRKYLNEMSLAQDIMEGLSGYTAEEIDYCIKDVKADTTGTKSLAGTILPQSTTYGNIEVVSGTGDVLTYKFSDVETVGTNYNKYLVELVLDPTGDDQKGFNDQNVANISEINQYYDATFEIPTEDIETAAKNFALSSTIGTNQNSYVGKMVRTTTVKIENLGTEAAPNYRVGVYRNYTLASGEAAILGNSNTDHVLCSKENISRMDSDKFPRSVYIYFKGIENASYNDVEKRENFVVENTTGEEITVYLIRTQNADAYGNLAQSEMDYNALFGCRVAVVSKDMSGASTQDVHIVSNLRYDLSAPSQRYNFRTHHEDGSELLTDELKKVMPATKDNGDPMTAGDSTYKSYRAEYYYNGSLLTEDIYKTNFSAGYKRKDKNTIYKATVNLYDPSTGKKVATFDGGVSN